MANQQSPDAPESSGQGQIIRQGTSGVSDKVLVRWDPYLVYHDHNLHATAEQRRNQAPVLSLQTQL